MMNTEEKIKAEELRKRIVAGGELSQEEELFYLVKVMKYTKQEAETILTIAANKNKNKNVFID